MIWQYLGMALALVLFCVVLYLAIRKDFDEFLINKKQKHGRDWRNRALMLMPSMILLSLPRYGDWHTWLYALLVLGFLFWLLFDGLSNLKKREYFYKFDPYGEYFKQFTFWFPGDFDDPVHKDALLDRLQRLLGVTGSKIVKLGGLAVSVFLYIHKLVI